MRGSRALAGHGSGQRGPTANILSVTWGLCHSRWPWRQLEQPLGSAKWGAIA